MRRQVWSVDEIRDILVAANRASGISAAMMLATDGDSQNAEKAAAYRQGFKAALVSVAIALGTMPMSEQEIGEGAIYASGF
jgi:hypothetical protein